MRSDELTERALAALERPRAAFLSAVATAVGELAPLLVTDDGSREARSRRAATSLGAFADGRVDAGRFASLVSDRPELAPAVLEAVGRARAALSGLVAAGPEQFVVRVEPGADVGAAVSEAFRRLGRAFGAARVAALGRAGAYRSGEHGALLEGLPFDRWSRQERRLAPPLVVRVTGPELQAAGLAGFLDGSVRLAIVAPEATGPAPLSPLVSPGVFVAQGDGPEVLEGLASTAAPAVVAVLGSGAASFVHDPAGGPAIGDRLRVDRLPELEAEAGGSRSGFRVREELAQLRVLADMAAAVAAAPGTAERTESDPADLLAAWLLRQANLPSPKGNGAA